MPYDLARLASYVRFYLTVRKQIDGAWGNLSRTHGAVQEAVAPFVGPLGRLGSTALAETASAFDPGPALDLSAKLFVPDDEERLSGLADVYEVVGHFSFQGEGNENLARVQALVSSARNEIVTQRMRLTDLTQIPDVARSLAARLAADESARSTSVAQKKAAGFDPLAEQVAQRAKQTLDAVKGVPIPDLTQADSAAEDYRRFVAKLDQVYQTCLPFLRKSIATLYAYVGAEPTATWPDSLPLVRELPSELVTVPPLDSPELSQARGSAQALAEEEIQLGRARDATAGNIARIEGDLTAVGAADGELEQQITTATRLADLAAARDAAERAQVALTQLEQQKAELLRAAGLVWQRHKQIEAGLRLLEEELATRVAEITAVGEALVKEKKDEPVLFGKDDWRGRVAALEAQGDALRQAHAERTAVFGGLKIDLSRVSVEVQTEQQQGLLLDRRIADVRATLEASQKAQRELAVSLGVARPPRPMTVVESREGLALLQQARADNGQRGERLRAELRRQKEETGRVLTRLKQVSVERAQVEAMVQTAQVAATEGREGALKHLAEQRRAAVERHVSEVLGTLEKSLGVVATVFVEPARAVMNAAPDDGPPESMVVQQAADRLAPIVEKLARELGAELLAQDAGLGQIQREFCDVAAGACRAAWS